MHRPCTLARPEATQGIATWAYRAQTKRGLRGSCPLPLRLRQLRYVRVHHPADENEALARDAADGDRFDELQRVGGKARELDPMLPIVRRHATLVGFGQLASNALGRFELEVKHANNQSTDP